MVEVHIIQWIVQFEVFDLAKFQSALNVNTGRGHGIEINYGVCRVTYTLLFADMESGSECSHTIK